MFHFGFVFHDTTGEHEQYIIRVFKIAGIWYNCSTNKNAWATFLFFFFGHNCNYTSSVHHMVNECREWLSINIRQYSPRDKSAVFCPDLPIFLGTASFISSFSPYKQNKKINWIEVWNWRTAKWVSLKMENSFYNKLVWTFLKELGNYLIPQGKLKDSASNKSPR